MTLKNTHKFTLTMIPSIIFVYLGFNYSLVYADISIKDQDLKVELVATGFNSPTSMAFLGPNDILVLEKDGKVQRIAGNMTMSQTVLDITTIIDSTKERGLLGIAISPEAKYSSGHDIPENGRYKNNPNIYLFYTEKGIISDDLTVCLPQLCNMPNYAVKSLYKYNIKDGHLVNRTVLIYLPSNSEDPAYDHVGGAIRLGSDHNIYIPSGDGRGCSNYDYCKKSMNGGALDSQAANSRSGKVPIGNAGILYLPNDGNVSRNKGILGNQYPLNLYYAYGIRNSFGIDFDPVTGNLWDTENGPNYGDEINLVVPGFNSGWTKIQGIWPIRNYTEMVTIPEGSPSGHLPHSYKLDSENETMFDFNGRGKYSQPEFTWNLSVGVTSIKFLNSDKLGKEYENDIFVATFNSEGSIYHFDLDKDRKNLKLRGQLEDRVAGNNDELNDVFFAGGFGSITDLEVGPDGYLYVLSIGKGAIFKITPKYNIESKS